MNTQEILSDLQFDVKKAVKEAIIRPDEKIKAIEHILWIEDRGNWLPIASRGNLSCIIGKAKSRKTFFITMICAAFSTGRLFEKFKALQSSEKVVLFDTEQGRYRALKVLNRILHLSGRFDNLEVLSLRKYSPFERIQIIQEYLQSNKVSIAFIDGVRDLVTDFNNLEKSSELVNELMRLSEVYNCHICTVLHMNKADTNARGHLGTELMNKAETVISISKEKMSSFSDVEPVYTRDIEFTSFQFTVIDNLPVICGYENHETITNTTKGVNPNRNFEPEKEELPF